MPKPKLTLAQQRELVLFFNEQSQSFRKFVEEHRDEIKPKDDREIEKHTSDSAMDRFDLLEFDAES